MDIRDVFDDHNEQINALIGLTKPDHPDFWLLQTIMLDQDIGARDYDATITTEHYETLEFVDVISQKLGIDRNSAMYASMQKGIRAVVSCLNKERTALADPSPGFIITLMASTWMSGLMSGIEFEKRKGKSPENNV